MNISTPALENESQRLQALLRYEILDTPFEESFDRITRLAASLFSAPIAVIGMIDQDRIWIKSSIGVLEREVSREGALSAWAIFSHEVLVIEDALKDIRFKNTPYVTGEGRCRFYAGAPIVTPEGFVVGTLSVIDAMPRTDFTSVQRENLAGLAGLVVDQLEFRRATMQLRDSEKSYRDLFDNSPVGIYRSSPSGEIIMANSVVLDMFGYPSLEALKSKNMEKDRLVLDREEWRTKLELAGQLANYEGIWYNRDGKAIHVRETTRVIRRFDGAIAFYEGWAEDISRQKAAEAESEEARLFNQKLIAAVPDLISIFDVKVGRSVFTNRSYFHTVGQDPESVRKMENPVAELVHPEDVPRLQAHRQQCCMSEDGHILELEFRVRDGSGNYRILSCREMVFLRDPDGAVTHLLGIYANISEHRSMQERLRRDEERWQLVMAANNDGLWDWDGLTNTIFHSQRWRQILGYANDDSESPDDWESLLHPQDAKRVKKSLAAYLGREVPAYQEEYRLRAKGGSYRWVFARGIAQWDSNNKPLRMVGAHSDITDRKQAELALKVQAKELAEARDKAEADARAKSSFLATMSHEIRTPLNGIIGMTGILADTELTGDQQDYLRTICSSGEALLSIINDVLDFSKIESGHMELEEADFDLRMLVEEAVDLVAAAADRKGLELLCSMDPSMPANFRGDASRLRQILLNLLSNAVKFTQCGEVVISVNCVPETDSRSLLRFAVSDTGIGMSPEVRSRVFDAFSQADASTTRRFGGTGLGLAICKQLTKLMQGSIAVVSESGVGSTFSLEVILGAPGVETGIELGDSLRGLRALVVDDNETNLQILRYELSSFGITVVSASTGAQALTALQNSMTAGNRIDLALLDFHMPYMDGLMLTRAIRAQPRFQDLPIILLASATQRNHVRDTNELNISGYLVKPLRRGQLLTCIRSILLEKRNVVREARSTVSVPFRVPNDSTSRLLLAEDNPVNQKVGVLILKRLGYLVDVVKNGREAIQAFQNVRYDAILLDCQMPEMDGFEATRAIRQMEGAERRVPIIALTANAFNGEKERCLEAGMDDYLSKPVNQSLLGEKLTFWVLPEDHVV